MQPDLIVFGEDWGAHPSATQHLVRNLAADRRILWMNSIGLRRPRFTAHDAGRAFRKLNGMLRGHDAKAPSTKADPDSLKVVAPIAISWPGNPVAQAFNQWSLSCQIRSASTAHGLRRPVLWTSLPTACLARGSASERALVYYCGDDFGALAGVDHGPVTRMERGLAERADLIFAASEKLAERFPASKTILLPHGVDLDLFSRPAERAPDLPDGRPIAGFYGSISDWVDVELMAAVAREMQDWNFVLVGPVRTDIAKLRGLSNITLLGEKPHASLPSYVQHWDVALLPFRQNSQILSCNPLKLREYLATGKPIVSTPFHALEPYSDIIEIARGAQDFASAIRRAAEDGARNGERSRRMLRETWAVRAAEVSAALAVL